MGNARAIGAKRKRDEKKRRPGRGDFHSSPIRIALLLGIAAKVMGIALIFDPAGAQSFDLVKSLFSRGTAWLLAAFIVLATLRYGLVILPRSRLHVAVLAFVLVNLASLAVAENRYLALYGELGRYQGITYVVDMTVLYLAAAIAIRTLTDWLVLGIAFSATVVFVSTYAFVQRLGLDPVAWKSDVRQRPFSSLGNPDMLGHFISISLGVIAGTLISGFAIVGP